jgi:hypothetical protein
LALWFGAAHAADPASLSGKWIEKFANGNGMVTEFSAAAIAYYPVDASGKATESPRENVATYRDLDPKTIRVELQGGGGILIRIQDKNTIQMDFPGMAAHRLVRLR